MSHHKLQATPQQSQIGLHDIFTRLMADAMDVSVEEARAILQQES